jgi:hypothetical protein
MCSRRNQVNQIRIDKNIFILKELIHIFERQYDNYGKQKEKEDQIT